MRENALKIIFIAKYERIFKVHLSVERTKQFQTSDGAEAQGSVMIAWVNHQLANDTEPLLKERGIETIDVEGWYKMQDFLDVMKEIIEKRQNITSTLVSVGKQSVEGLPLADFDSVEAFKGFAEALHGMVTRNTPEHEGHIIVQEEDDIYIVNNTPIANDLIYGFWWEVLRKYKINGKRHSLIVHQDYPSYEIGSIFKLKPITDY